MILVAVIRGFLSGSFGGDGLVKTGYARRSTGSPDFSSRRVWGFELSVVEGGRNVVFAERSIKLRRHLIRSTLGALRTTHRC